MGVTLATVATKHGGQAGAGVVAETIAAGSYGLLQVYGYHSAARVRALTGGTPVVATGTCLGAVAAAFCLDSIAVSVASTAVVKIRYPVAFSLGAATAGFTTTTGAVFIRAL